MLKTLELEPNLRKYLIPLQVMVQIPVLENIKLQQQFHPLTRYQINGNLVKEAL